MRGKGVPDSYGVISPEHANIMKELGISGDMLETLREEIAAIEEEADTYLEK